MTSKVPSFTRVGGFITQRRREGRLLMFHYKALHSLCIETATPVDDTKKRDGFFLKDEMVRVRQLSGLSGPEHMQQNADSYLHSPNKKRILARRSGKLVGYLVAKLYKTSHLALGSASYKPTSLQDGANTIIVDEVVVAKSEQGRGVAGILLKESVASSPSLTNLECCVLTTNAASEALFMRLAQHQGVKISFGPAMKSSWGNYVNWKIKLGFKDDRKKKKEEGKGARLLTVDNNNMFQWWSSCSGARGYYDRNDLLARVRKKLLQ
eukprot:CAMPEP_0206390622 /NCGR_PEP_ID=MMETSP0294-20121207/18729_1 /ASSEMBLY_ACC=CAM_ASM_000327 /TAXON_ID=39354 /ORGANISM="Heterosigma akashiwo, Strain CCMP2393" /LENGTH=265 /DNA_ID=CAMNT_0053843057 /DNA_START=12 /DNA_END=809 /DNA_ORIENTATION=+